MYKFIIGCDMSKSTFDVAYFAQQDSIYLGSFPNTVEGYEAMVKQLQAKSKHRTSSWFVCFENTGAYSKALLNWLLAHNIPCREENPLQISKSLGLKRGKDDKADARAICLYAYQRRDSIQADHLPDKRIVILKKLLSRRALLVRQKKALQVSLGEQVQNLDPLLQKTFKQQNEELLNTYSQQIKAIEQLLKQTIEQDDDMNNNNQLIQSVVGIGPITAAYLLAFTENFSCFTDARKFASYIGIAPFPNRSGTYVGKTRISNMANKRIKSIISNGVQAAINHDPGIKQYFDRKVAEGKEKKKVINAVRNKIIHRVFAVVKRQTPYVKLTYA